MKLIDYWDEINKEKKAFIHTSRSVSYRAHIGDEYYVTINNSTRVANISRTLHPVYILRARVSLSVLSNGLISQHCHHPSTNVIRNKSKHILSQA